MFGFLKRRSVRSSDSVCSSGFQHQLNSLIVELHQRAADVECAGERERLSAELVQSEAELSESLREWKRLQTRR